jgi:serine/threonine protein kinase
VTAVLLSRNSGFAEFKLRGHRGSGGFSDVYEAVGPNGERVALKVLRVPGGPNDANFERFERELRILQRIDNRRIARLVAAKLDADPPWIASEFIDGPNLREAVNEKGHFEIRQAVQLFSIVVKALSEIHAEGISHRDITPNNILLGEFGPVIIDFGSAKENLTSDIGSVLSVGTPEFAAPEVMKGDKAGSASDIYSLAKVFNFLTGVSISVLGNQIREKLSPAQSQAIVNCLLEAPEQRPTSAELTKIFPISDYGSELTNVGYEAIRISKLPRRIGVKLLVLSLSVTAALVSLLTAFFVSSEVRPLTVEMIQSEAADHKPNIFFSKNIVEAGWLLAGPAFAEEELEYRKPNELDQTDSPLGLEGYSSNVMPRKRYLEIKVDVLRHGIGQTLKNIDLTLTADFSLSDYQVIADRFDNFLNKFQADYTLGACTMKRSEKLSVQPNSKTPRLRLLGMLDGCKWEKNDLSGYAVMDIYPQQNAVVYTTAYGRDGVLDLESLLDSFVIRDESIIRDVFSEYSLMFADRSDDSFALDTIDGAKTGGHHQFARRAFRLKPNSAVDISRVLSDGTGFLDTGHSPVSIYFYNEVASNSVDSPQFEDFLFSFGQIINLDRFETRIFNNYQKSDMVLIAEVTQSQRLSIGLQIRQRKAIAPYLKQFFFIEDFKASGSQVQEFEDTPDDFVFGLPTSESAEDQKRGDFRSIEGVKFPIPYGWLLVSDAFSPAAKSLVIHANPNGWPLEAVLADMPRLEIYDADINELANRRASYSWWFNDYDKCSKPSVHYRKTVGRTDIEWKILEKCSIQTEYSFGNSERSKAWQANPIIKFIINTFVGPLNSEVEMTVAMGEYVPELDTGVAFWEEFVDSIVEQADLINTVGIKKCAQLYEDLSCSTK